MVKRTRTKSSDEGTRSDLADQIKKSAKRKKADPKQAPEPTPLDLSRLIPTGSTLLNLAMSGHPEGGPVKGKVWNVPGDSHTGKTYLAFSVLAECSLLESYDHYRLIHDDAEAETRSSGRE